MFFYRTAEKNKKENIWQEGVLFEKQWFYCLTKDFEVENPYKMGKVEIEMLWKVTNRNFTGQ